MRLGTWNVNGIRARFDEVVRWADTVQPDVFCLQEIKASAGQVPEPLTGLPDYWSFWHGLPGGYSGVSLHVRRSFAPDPPPFAPPPFDVEARIAEVDLGAFAVASVYVPNGNRDYALKLRFLESLRDHAADARRRGRLLFVAGDLNVARTDADVHPKQLKPGVVGQRPEERALFEALVAEGLADVTRELAPDDPTIFTWWPPWREEKRKNRGWRIDYVLAPRALLGSVRRSEVMRDVGSSDHAPLVVDVELPTEVRVDGSLP